MQTNEQTHPNSRKITILRASSFISRAQGKEVDDAYADSMRSIGSYWDSRSNRKVGSGLSREEEDLLMPPMIGSHPTDKTYLAEVRAFFHALTTKVPHKYGLDLEIGLEKSNDQKLSPANLPINPMEYIRYRHARNHPFMAQSEEEAIHDSRKWWYIYDPVVSTQTATVSSGVRDQAVQYYMLIKDNHEKVKMTLLLMGEDYRTHTGTTREQTEQRTAARLWDLAIAQPEKLIKVHENQFFDYIFLVRNLALLGLLTRAGDRYTITETGKILGSEEEAVLFFREEERNAQDISILKGKAKKLMDAPQQPRKTKAPQRLPTL